MRVTKSYRGAIAPNIAFISRESCFSEGRFIKIGDFNIYHWSFRRSISKRLVLIRHGINLQLLAVAHNEPLSQFRGTILESLIPANTLFRPACGGRAARRFAAQIAPLQCARMAQVLPVSVS